MSVTFIFKYCTGCYSACEIGASKNGESQIRVRIWVKGRNLAEDGTPKVHTYAKKVLLQPDEALDLLSEDHINVSFSGVAETPDGETSPFEIEYLD